MTHKPGHEPTSPRVVIGAPPDLGASAGDGPKLIGVQEDHSVPANYGDFFKPGGHVVSNDLGIAGYGTAVPTNAPHLPQYRDGAEDVIASLSAENLARLQIRLAKTGLIGSTTKVQVGVADDATVAAYRDLLGVANRYAVSDTDALALLESDPSVLGGITGGDLAGGGAAAGPTTHTSTSTSTQNFTALDAEAVADRAYQDALGADATPAQRKALRAALNAYAQANPSVTKQTTTTGTDGNSTSTSTNTGGIDAGGVQQIALNQAQAAPDYAEVQAATTYMNALQSALGATANVG